MRTRNQERRWRPHRLATANGGSARLRPSAAAVRQPEKAICGPRIGQSFENDRSIKGFPN
jgi:hypothetical protein